MYTTISVENAYKTKVISINIYDDQTQLNKCTYN